MLDQRQRLRHELLGEFIQPRMGLAGVDADLLHPAALQIAQHPHPQGQILVQQSLHLHRLDALRDGVPQLLQKQHVGAQSRLLRPLRRRAANEAAGVVLAQEILHDAAQPRPLRLAFDALRHPADFAIRHEHLIHGRNGDVRGQPRPLRAQRVFDDLHHQILALVESQLDLLVAGAAEVAGVEVRHMQKRRALQADVHERRLHARQHPRHAALVNVADQPALAHPLDQNLLQHPVLDDGDAGLRRRHIDQDLVAHRPAGPTSRLGSTPRSTACIAFIRSIPQKLTAL